MSTARAVIVGALLCLGASLSASIVKNGPREVELVRRAHYLMGTIFEISAYTAERAQTAAAIENAFAAIRTSDEVLSHYREGNALERLNSLAATQAVAVPGELRAVLELSGRFSKLSHGAFDVTAGPLVELWRSAADRGRVPSSEELKENLSRVGPDKVRLLPGSRVRFAQTGVSVNFGAIGKGWAVDRALEVLQAHGVANCLISAGTSTIYALGGGRDGEGWSVELQDPEDPAGKTLTTFLLKDAALSTSAGYERFVEIGGRRYGHIIDPRTGWPVDHTLSVTVITPAAAEADALSTAVFVLGLEEGAALLRSLGHGGFLVGRPEDSCTPRQLTVNLDANSISLGESERTQYAGQR